MCSVLSAFSFIVAPVAALKFPLQTRSNAHSTSVHLYNDPYGFENHKDQFYSSTIRISGEPFQVSLDTGSSDLWIDPAVNDVQLLNTTNTLVIGEVGYGDNTTAIGNITLAELTWGDFTIPNQAFINAIGSNATFGGVRSGLLGLGPPSLAQIPLYLDSNNSSINGDSVLENIFNLYPDEPNIITFLLSRSASGVVDGGDFTIGEVTQGYEAITSEPKLPVMGDRWFTFMDGITVNGRHLDVKSNTISSAIQVPEDKLLTIFDTGISLTLAPESVAQDMFKDISGSVYDPESQTYIIPCDTKMNVSILLSGKQYPLHPLDMVTPAMVNATTGEVVCIAPFVFLPGLAELADFQFGDVIMRNMYTLFDFGYWTKTGDNQPFIQVLSVTDQNHAWTEFDVMNPMRLKEFLQYANSQKDEKEEEESDVSSSGALATNSDSDLLDLSGLIRNTYIIMGLLGLILVLLLAIIVISIIRLRKSKKQSKKYKTLKDPYPPSHDDDHSTLYSNPALHNPYDPPQ